MPSVPNSIEIDGRRRADFDCRRRGEALFGTDGMCELRHQRAATRAALVLVQLGLRRVQALSWSGNRDGDRLAEVDSRPVADRKSTRMHWFSGQTGFGVSAQRFTRRL